MKKLGDAELEIMLVLWEVKEPVTSSYILDRVKETRTWKLPTLMTILARLAEKGFVHCDRSTRTNYYTAIIGEKEYKEQESHSFLEKLYGNSLQNLVATLYNGKVVSKDDLKELKKMIEEIEEREKHGDV